jgi:hypothetical protein
VHQHIHRSDAFGDALEEAERIAYEFAGKGTPRGSYLLAFFAFLTTMLTGFQSAYGRLAFAGFGLTVVWVIVNARYPAD